MGYELRLEINIDVIKRDIEPEQVRQAIEQAIRDKFKHPAFRYEQIQSVRIVSPV